MEKGNTSVSSSPLTLAELGSLLNTLAN